MSDLTNQAKTVFWKKAGKFLWKCTLGLVVLICKFIIICFNRDNSVNNEEPQDNSWRY